MELVADGQYAVGADRLCQPCIQSLCASIQRTVLDQIHGLHNVLDFVILSVSPAEGVVVMLVSDEDDSVLPGEIPDGFKVSAASVTGDNAEHNIRLPD